MDMFEVLQQGDLEHYGRLVRKTWQQNKLLDAGTEPEIVAQLCRRIDDLCWGYKLPGAGGGGYLYMVAKDPEAAAARFAPCCSTIPSRNRHALST